MVNVNMKVGGGNPQTPRGQRQQENLERLRANQPQGVRVVPGEHPSMSEEQIRKNIKHPRNNITFRSSGSVEWPNDRFTQKQLRAGVVKLAEESNKSGEQDRRHQDRQQSPRQTARSEPQTE
jgi:hypothetical protein